MESIILKANNITKYFNQPEPFQVLRGISIGINKGEFVSIIGKSGSGKTTLLYILATLDTMYTGNLEINGISLTGKDVNHLAKFRNKHVGFVFQFHYLLQDFSCLKNVMIPARKLNKYPIVEIEEKAYQLLTMLDIKEQALKPAGKLSGGQQQRVAIARALINEPAIIMTDEPTGNLDSKNSEAIGDIFKHLTREFGQTVIAVTHNTDFARNSDRVLEMLDGNIFN